MAVVFAASFQWSKGAVSAQTTGPLTLARLSFSDLTYLGGFRLPRTGQGDTFEAGGSLLAFNPARNSLFINSRRGKLAEVTIPAPFNTNDVNQMPFAAYLQNFYDPTEGHFHEIAPDGAALAGLIVQGDRLYATGSIYYDASNSQVLSHFSHSTNLSQSSFVGMSQVWETGKTGYVAGYLANIPSEWQSVLGGSALTGQCCIPIVTRTSFGPAAFSWEPSMIARNAAIPATPLLYYTQSHATLGPWDGANEIYGGTALMGGAAVIAGTRTALFVGRNGLGTFCYGHGTANAALTGTKAPDGEKYCYDPTEGSKGQHAYPYRYQIWAYDLADFAAVKAGSKQPWEVVPYATWPFEFPTPEQTVRIGGVAYDAQQQLLYVSQWLADRDGYAYRPIVHALKINVPVSNPPAPQATTVTLTPNVPAPQAPGTSIVWSANATGGSAAYEYKWAAYANGAWTMVRDWSASPTYEWQPATADQNARVAVWVRTAPTSAPNPTHDLQADAIEAIAEYPYAIVDTPADPPSAVSSVSLTSNLASPQPKSSSIVWTATPTGGAGSYLYKWFVFDGSYWTATGPWADSNRFTWTPATANANYRVAVWVKREASTSENPEAAAETAFAITEPATAVSSVTLSSNVTAPQSVGSTITWTAMAAGGSGAVVYKWFVSNDGGTSWTATGPFASSNQLTWTPAAANAKYRIAVWAKRESSASDGAEAAAEAVFAITERPVTSVTMSSNLPSPQPVSSTIVWTATQSGATGSVVYKWFISNDGGGSWTSTGPWSSSNQLTWTPALARNNYRVAVWAKRASNDGDSGEAAAETAFAVVERPVSSVALTANLVSPQPLSSTIVWTATAAGGTGALVYKWFVSSDGGASWTSTGAWAASNQLSWTPTVATNQYRVAVWAKRAANPSDSGEAVAEAAFAIIAPTVASVTLTSNVPSPQPLSATIQWTATPTGGSGALVYKWFVSGDNGGSWTAAGPWAASNQLIWTPTDVNANYRITVWVKRAANAAEGPEAAADRPFVITQPLSGPILSVGMNANLVAPQPTSTSIVWTATALGGSGNTVYKWFIFDGSNWTATGPWASSNQLTWTPTTANPNYRVAVWAKRASNTTESPEAAAEVAFPIR